MNPEMNVVEVAKIDQAIPKACLQSKIGSCSGCSLETVARDLLRAGLPNEAVVEQVGQRCIKQPDYRIALRSLDKRSPW